MPQKKVSALAGAINAAHLVVGRDEVITDITNDSRLVRPGSLYAALPGEHVDGHAFIDDAILAGARGILCSRPPAQVPDGVAVFQSRRPRFAFSEIADAFFDRPSDRLEVVGVTGTDGKTTTVYFIHQLLQAAGTSSAFLSTAAMSIGDAEYANRLHQSTPEAAVLHATLSDMAAGGNSFAVLESTSHGLSAKTCRLAHVRYRAAILTNLTHEHLEFHGIYERYRDEKANLFRALDTGRYGNTAHFQDAVDSASHHQPELATPDPAVAAPDVGVREVRSSGERFGIVNLDSPEAAFFAGVTNRPVFGYGTGATRGTVWATDLRPDATGTRLSLGFGNTAVQARLSVPGVFNVENALAAVLAVALLTDHDPIDLAPALIDLRPVRGRMNVVASAPFSVIVDYAHTPGSFRRVLPYFREHTRGRLIVVFGSAGERDRGKRPLQGRIADQFADVIILTDEDPRGEPRTEILDQIAAGCPGREIGKDLRKIPDRREAINAALSLAQPGDTVLLLGKGHETSILGPDSALAWDEELAVREELARLGIETRDESGS
ncbi:MAG: Mur ligase family protein [Spirochaetia bacterium]